jgi:lysozyme
MEDLVNICNSYIATNEGLRQHIYKDSKGNETVGWGHLVSNGFSHAVCKLMFDEDIEIALKGCRERIEFFNELDTPRQYVLVNMAFNMGIGGLMGFERMLAHMKEKQFEEAANDLSKSLEFQEVPDRVSALIKIMETGKIGN